MSDYENYEEYLFFGNTNRTESSCEMVDKIAELTKWLDLKSEYISKIEEKNKRLQELLGKCAEWLTYIDRDNGIIAEIDKLLGEDE